MARTPTDPTKAQVWVTKGIDDLDFEFYFPQGPKGDPGGFVSAVSLGTSLLDDIKTPGHYRQDNGNNATVLNGYPVASAAGFLEVLQAVTPGDLIQRFTPVAGAPTGSGRAMYIRRYFAGSWGSWYSYTATRVDQTAGRVIYKWDDLNGREQIIYGDTGRRDITASFPSPALGKVFLSRNGNYANLIFADYQDASTATSLAVPAGTIPAGFRPQNWLYQPAASSRLLVIKADGGLTMSPHNSTVWQGGFTWRTEDPWPATLPGLATGSTPNV